MVSYLDSFRLAPYARTSKVYEDSRINLASGNDADRCQTNPRFGVNMQRKLLDYTYLSLM